MDAAYTIFTCQLVLKGGASTPIIWFFVGIAYAPCQSFVINPQLCLTTVYFVLSSWKAIATGKLLECEKNNRWIFGANLITINSHLQVIKFSRLPQWNETRNTTYLGFFFANLIWSYSGILTSNLSFDFLRRHFDHEGWKTLKFTRQDWLRCRWGSVLIPVIWLERTWNFSHFNINKPSVLS